MTYRNPAILAKMAVTVDHISGGRLDFGIGAAWHEAEHRGYGIAFPSPGARVAMVDEALTVIRRLWTEDRVTFTGRFFTLQDALCEPKPVQSPHPPIVIGASQPKMLLVVARHADEWNMPGHDGPQTLERREHRARRGLYRSGPRPRRDPAFRATVPASRAGRTSRCAACAIARIRTTPLPAHGAGIPPAATGVAT